MTRSVADISVVRKDSEEHALQALWDPIKWFLCDRFYWFVISVHKNVAAISKLVPFFQCKHDGQHLFLNWLRNEFLDPLAPC